MSTTATTKIYEKHKEMGKYSLFTRKKEFEKTMPMEAQVLEFLVGAIKTTVVNMFNELKETINRRSKGSQENDV